MKKTLEFIKEEKIFSILFLFTFLISLRSIFLTLSGDEITYYQIAENILKGKYYQTDYPSSVVPIIPFMMAFFKIDSYPLLGFILHKITHILLTILALRYVFLLLVKLNIEKKIIYSLLLLIITASGYISSHSSLYPEAIVMFSFWGFMYYLNEPKNIHNYKRLFIFLIILIFTRHLFAVLGGLLLVYYFDLIKNPKKQVIKFIVISILFSTPLFLWIKYVYFVESSNLSEISYFNRFKSDDNILLYNIKCGLGLEQHYEVKKINGVPAFISLFIPITGIRNYTISIILLLLIFWGYYKNLKIELTKYFLIAFCLVFIGLILAGTGFSRYWLVLLPIIYLGYYYAFLKLNLSNIYFIYFSQIVSLLLIVNEIRLTYLIFYK